MKINIPIKSFHDIEELLALSSERLPKPPKSVLDLLVRVLPFVALFLGSGIIGLAVVPFFGNFEAIDIFAKSGLYTFNVILLRIVLVIVGIILITSFNLLASRKPRGWYNLFYLTIFHFLFVIIMPHIYSFLLLLLSWYVLFSIKKSYVS